MKFWTSGLYQSLGKKTTFSAEEKRNWEARAHRWRKMKVVEKKVEKVNEAKKSGGGMKESGGLLGEQKKDQR